MTALIDERPAPDLGGGLMARLIAAECDCGFRRRGYRSEAQAQFALRQHSCEKQRRARATRARGRARRAQVDRTPKPCLHKVANHVHGTHACYVLDACRCLPCAAANATYERERAKAHATGRFTGLVDAQPTRQHVRALMATGVGLTQITKLSGCSGGTMNKLLYGTPRADGTRRQPCARIKWETAVRLQAIPLDGSALAGGAPVPALGTHRRVQALVAAGWSQSKLCERIGVDRGNFWGMMQRDQVQKRTADAVAALFDELADVDPPRDTHRDKIAYSRAINHARENDWAHPGAWLGIDIDDPNTHPNATGYDEDRVAAVMAGALIEGDEQLELALTQVDRLEILRRGHATWPWHSDNQVAARVGIPATVFYADKQRARTPRKYAPSGELDEIAVERFMTGTLRLPKNARSPERLEAIARLAARGMNDTEIGERVGLEANTVGQLRLRNNITSGVSRQGRQKSYSDEPIAVIGPRSHGSADGDHAPRRRPPAA
jgi:hypothetical protein